MLPAPAGEQTVGLASCDAHVSASSNGNNCVARFFFFFLVRAIFCKERTFVIVLLDVLRNRVGGSLQGQHPRAGGPLTQRACARIPVFNTGGSGSCLSEVAPCAGSAGGGG